jgi:hypothetical protein
MQMALAKSAAVVQALPPHENLAGELCAPPDETCSRSVSDAQSLQGQSSFLRTLSKSATKQGSAENFEQKVASRDTM